MSDKSKLMNSSEFDKAILEGVECRKNMISTYKEASKANFERFYQTMLDANPNVAKAIETPKRKRDDAQNELIKDFKQMTRKQYNLVSDFMMKEEVEAGKLTKVEKLAEKIGYALSLLRYVDHVELDKTFNKYGLSITTSNKLPTHFENKDIQENVKDIFNSSVILRQSIKDENKAINETIFESKVPVELQFDKDTNQSGIKPSDFRKLVDAKTKLEVAKTKDAKTKVEERIQKLASNAQFDMARTELVRDKLTNL